MFRPCPICGRSLTINDIRFNDGEASIGELEDALRPDGTFDLSAFRDVGESPDEMLADVEEIGIFCNCGYAFWVPNDFKLSDPSWLKDYAIMANRRWKE